MANTVWSGGAGQKLYLQSGEFTSTCKTSVSVAAIDVSPFGVSWDNTNTPWSGIGDDKLYLTSGQFTSTIKTSYNPPTNPEAISADTVPNTYYEEGNVLYYMSGQFSATIRSTGAGYTWDFDCTGISWDGTDTLFSGSTDDKLYLISGRFVNTLKTSEDISGVSVNPEDISYNDPNTLWIVSGTNKMYLTSGKFTATLKTSQSVAAIDAFAVGIETDEIIGRMGFAPPSGVAAADGHVQVVLTWSAAFGADSYNVYWDTSPGVTQSTGTKVEGVISGYAWEPPAGYDTGVSYYFVVTAYSAVYGESADSSEVNGIPYWLDLSSEQDLSETIYDIHQQTSTEYWFAATSGGIWRSTDGGSTWVKIDGLDSTDADTIDVTTNGYIYVGTAGGRIYYSSDNGASFAQAAVNQWRAINGGDSVWGLAHSTNRLYVVGDMQPGVDPQVFYTDDFGATFTGMGTLGMAAGGQITDICVNSTNGDIMIVTAEAAKYHFYYNGSTWSNVTDADGACKSIICEDDVYYTGSSSNGKVRKSSNNGSSWSTLTGSACPSATDVENMTYDNGIIYACTDSTNGRLYKSDTGGTAWENTYVFSGKSEVHAAHIDFTNGIIVVGADTVIYSGPLPGLSAPVLTATDGTLQTVESWNTVAGAISYNLYWSLTSGVTKTTGTKIASVTSPYTHSSMTTYNVSYYYVVTAESAIEESSDSNEDSAVPWDYTSELVAIATGYHTIHISWGAVVGATSYNLYWSLTPGVTTSSNVISGLTGGTEYNHIGRESGITYYYAVAGVVGGVEQSLSNEDDATCPIDSTPWKHMLWHLLPRGRFWQK